MPSPQIFTHFEVGINLINFLKKRKTCSLDKLTQNPFYFNAVLDASGFVGSGFVWGNNYWLGSQRACNFVNTPVRVALAENPPKNHIPNLDEIASPISVGYRVVWAKHYSKWQLDIKTFDKVNDFATFARYYNGKWHFALFSRQFFISACVFPNRVQMMIFIF